MSRNLPISSRISVDVQQLFEDLIVVKCNVNNKEFQGILLNTSKSFFGINESRLKGGPENWTVNDSEKANISFSCSAERYSYKIDGSGANILTRHPVKRHKSPPVSGKHVICQKCQSVVTIPADQADHARRQSTSEDAAADPTLADLDSRDRFPPNRRKSSMHPRRNSNFDTRENFESTLFKDVVSKVETPITRPPSIGGDKSEKSTIFDLPRPSSPPSLRKLLKKKKKKDKMKDKAKEVEPEPVKVPSKPREEIKAKLKKRKLESNIEKIPLKKTKVFESEAKALQAQAVHAVIPGKPLKTPKPKEEERERKERTDSIMNPASAKSASREPESKSESKSEAKGEAKVNAAENNPADRGLDKGLKRLKKRIELEKKLRKKKKAHLKEEGGGESSTKLNGSTERPKRLKEKSKDSSEIVKDSVKAEAEESSNSKLPSSSSVLPEVPKKERRAAAAAAAVAVAAAAAAETAAASPGIGKTLRRQEKETSDVAKTEGSNIDCEVSSQGARLAEAPKRKSQDFPPDSSMSLKIKINRTPSADNGGYQCCIVADDGHSAVSSSTSDIQAPPPPSTPPTLNAEVGKEKEKKEKEKEEVQEVQEEASASIVHLTRCTLPRGGSFAVGDVVWAKITGYPWWPSRITVIQQTERMEGKTKVTSYTAEVLWFNWDQISYIPCEKLYHFLDHYNSKCDKKRKGTYRNAVEQAWMAAQAAQSAADDDEEDEDDEEVRFDSYGQCISRPSSSGLVASPVSSSSASGVSKPSVSLSAMQASPSEPPASSSSSSLVSSSLGKGKRGVDTEATSTARLASVVPVNSHVDSSDDDSESGLVIDTEQSSQG